MCVCLRESEEESERVREYVCVCERGGEREKKWEIDR